MTKREWKADLRGYTHLHVKEALSGTRGAVVVGALLAIQLTILVLSTGPLITVSVFCAVPTANQFTNIFGYIHWLFLVLLMAGILALFRFPSLRLLYAVALIFALCALPAQAHFVSLGQLACDAP